jgi:dihydrofolate reductase
MASCVSGGIGGYMLRDIPILRAISIGLRPSFHPDRKEPDMRKVIVYEWMSADGVVQAPGAPDEDMTGGFQHGGWHLPYFDDISRNWVVDNLTSAGGFLFGRRTYEGFAGHWPKASDEEQVVARPLNTLPKYVASTTLTEPLEWNNSTLLAGDVGEAVAALKHSDGADLLVLGSTGLVSTLLEHGLVDEFRVMIDPIVLGGGKRVFRDDGVLRRLRLVDNQVTITTTGAILATYAVID